MCANINKHEKGWAKIKILLKIKTFFANVKIIYLHLRTMKVNYTIPAPIVMFTATPL